MHNFILTLTVFITTLLAEISFNLIQKLELTVPTKNYIGLFIVLFIFSFIKNKVIRFASMNMILIFSFFQMMHLKFYGIPVYPNAILLFFVESSEVFYTLIENLNLFIIPILLVLPGVLINYFLQKKLSKLRHIPFLHFLFIFYFFYNPIRTYATGNTWGRQPSSEELLGTNIYLSISYFLGRIAPNKLLKKENKSSFKPIVNFKNISPFKGNIILVLGESLSSNHMSLFGYQKETTPFLNSLKTDKNFNYYEAISSGVSTDIAVAMFMNSTYGLRGSEDIFTGKRCLFNLAKSNNFTTHFYSSQSQQQLRYITNSICLPSIQNYKSLDTIQPNIDNPNKADDKILIDLLPEDDKTNTNNFFILHQRGSHSPYKLRYTKEVFKLENEYKKDRVNHYDNSVYEFDYFMKVLIRKVQNYQKPTIIFYLSDHGEGLGEEGVWGHAALKMPSLQIPFFIYQHKVDPKFNFNFPRYPTQFNISLLVSKLLGFDAQELIHREPKSFQVLGNDLDGFAGYLEVDFPKNSKPLLKRKDI